MIIGSAVGGVQSYAENAELIFQTGDPRRVSPFGIPMLMVNGGSDLVSIPIGATGAVLRPSFGLRDRG
jgi:3-oxoacyl-(acyl-carrier-protein) synthase